MIEVVEASTATRVQYARHLIREFVAWHRRVHASDIDRVDRYFDAVAFEAELAGLPGKYAPPAGALFVAYVDGQPAGCVAMRDLGEGACEMKRMFVLETYRGRGLGRELAAAIITAAKSAGYRTMRLDTGTDQTEAISLYIRNGFRQVDAYYEVPDDVKNWLVFFELDLSEA